MSGGITSLSLYFSQQTTSSVYFISGIFRFLVNCSSRSTSSHSVLFSFPLFTNLCNSSKSPPPPFLLPCAFTQFAPPSCALNTEMNYLIRIGHLQQQSRALSKVYNTAKQQQSTILSCLNLAKL